MNEHLHNQPKNELQQNVKRHLIIRIGILVSVYSLVGLWYLIEPSATTGWGIIYVSLIYIPIFWLLFLILEALVLHTLKKKDLRNTNLLCLLASVVVLLMVFAKVFSIR